MPMLGRGLGSHISFMRHLILTIHDYHADHMINKEDLQVLKVLRCPWADPSELWLITPLQFLWRTVSNHVMTFATLD